VHFQTEQFMEEACRLANPVAYFPYKGELAQLPSHRINAFLFPLACFVTPAWSTFGPSSCLVGVGSSDTYTKEGHYSPHANAQIARCLEPVLREMINGRKR
jgi:hypothetical protein